MNGVDLLALVLTGIFESKAGDTSRCLFGDDLQTLNHAGNNFMLESRIKTLGILTNDHQVNIGITRGNVRKVAYGAEICIELELLAQLHVDAGKSSANWRADRAFERNVRSLD